MERMLVVAALALAAQGCEGEGDETERSAAPIAGEDASLHSAKLANVGAACSREQPCQGSEVECLTRSSTSSIYAGGYCTAACSHDAECGPSGLCPVSEAERLEPTYDFANSWPRKCFRGCTPGPSSGCRGSYRCLSLAEAYARPDAPTPMHQPVCIPLIATSTPTLNGMDAGARNDASTPSRRRDASAVASTESEGNASRSSHSRSRSNAPISVNGMDGGS